MTYLVEQAAVVHCAKNDLSPVRTSLLNCAGANTKESKEERRKE